MLRTASKVDLVVRLTTWPAIIFVPCILSHWIRRGACLAHHFQTPVWKRSAKQVPRLSQWMLFIDSRNSNKMAAVYTVYTSSIRIFNCFYFPCQPGTGPVDNVDYHWLSQTSVCLFGLASPETGLPGPSDEHWFFNITTRSELFS